MSVYVPIETADGSWTFRHSESNELYHNRAGAYLEALKLYVEPSGALEQLQATGKLTLLDACYGLGYNTWVLVQEAVNLGIPFELNVTAIESDFEVLQQLPTLIAQPCFNLPISENLNYYASNEIKLGIGQFLRIRFFVDDLRKIVPTLAPETVDVIYHDPFSPLRMPELWSLELFNCYKRLLKRGSGRLSTYSTAAAVRGGLMEAGFTIYTIPGLGVKTSSTLAFTAEPDVHMLKQAQPLRETERGYIATKAGFPYRDPDLNRDSATIRKERAAAQAMSSLPSGKHFRKSAEVCNSL